jgi:NAD(P)-dependent dehydrogenase (short-subunit alcohol dehydrogenase family)
MAVHLADRGLDVAIHHGRSDPAGTVAAVEARGRRAVALSADLASEEEAAALLPRAAEALGGPVTCLVNSASAFERDELATATRATWDAHMAVHLRAPFVLMQAMAAQGLAPRRGGEPVAAGLVVNLLDEKVLRLSPDFLTYTLSKMGLRDLTRLAAQAMAPAVRVNAIAPGPVLPAPRQREAHFAAMRAGTPLRRGSDPGEICAALSYLLDAPSVTGQVVAVDGGRHLRWCDAD